MNILDQGGPDGLIADGLAIAGKTGTLAGRFLDSPARERLRAKTGTLNTVTALTGFVHATQGPVLTFAYIANGEYVNPELLGLQEDLGGDLVVYPAGTPWLRAPSARAGAGRPRAGRSDRVARCSRSGWCCSPASPAAARLRAALPRAWCSDCLAGDQQFGVVLIERGSEVGGGDVRTDVGTVARILEAQELPDGRWVLATVGVERIEVERWLPDDPYPEADASPWPDDPPDGDLTEAYARARPRSCAGRWAAGRARRGDRALHRRRSPTTRPRARSTSPRSPRSARSTSSGSWPPPGPTAASRWRPSCSPTRWTC